MIEGYYSCFGKNYIIFKLEEPQNCTHILPIQNFFKAANIFVQTSTPRRLRLHNTSPIIYFSLFFPYHSLKPSLNKPVCFLVIWLRPLFQIILAQKRLINESYWVHSSRHIPYFQGYNFNCGWNFFTWNIIWWTPFDLWSM